MKAIDVKLILLLTVYVCCSSGGLLLFKLGNNIQRISVNISRLNFSATISLVSVAGLLLYVLSFVLFLVLSARYNLSYVFPIANGLVFLSIMCLSFIFFQEPFSFIKAIGGILILGGIIIINL